MHRNFENYPTHELGPIARSEHQQKSDAQPCIRGFQSQGLNEYIRREEADHELADYPFARVLPPS